MSGDLLIRPALSLSRRIIDAIAAVAGLGALYWYIGLLQLRLRDHFSFFEKKVQV